MEIRSGRGRQRRNWALAFGPQKLAGRSSEGPLFALICILALLLIAAMELVAGHRTSLGVISFIPVIAAAWYLSPRLSLTVAITAVVLRMGVVAIGAVEPGTALAQVLIVPALVLLSRTAAVAVLKNRVSETRVSEVEASKLRIAELEKAKSEFLRLASHELRSPVGVIAGYIAMLEAGDLGELPPAAREVMPVLTAKVRTINQLIEQMMETARLEDSRLQLQPARLEMGDLVDKALAYVGSLASANHTLVHHSAGRPVQVVVDAGRVATIVNNLLENAIKYSPEGGEISVRVVAGGKEVRVMVRDHGLGVPEAQMGRLFTRFGRIASEATSHIPGTGLGLYLSRELARMHGGDLVAQSVQGEGSTFTLLLPTAERAPRHLVERLAA